MPLTFNAGTHRELITVDWEDFEHLVNPLTGYFMAPGGVHSRSQHKADWAEGGPT